MPAFKRPNNLGKRRKQPIPTRRLGFRINTPNEFIHRLNQQLRRRFVCRPQIA